MNFSISFGICSTQKLLKYVKFLAFTTKQSNEFLLIHSQFCYQGRRKKGSRGAPAPLPHHFLEQKIFFHVKSKNNIFACQSHVRL